MVWTFLDQSIVVIFKVELIFEKKHVMSVPEGCKL